MVATVLEPLRLGRDYSKTVQLVFPIEDEADRIDAPRELPLNIPLEPLRKPGIRKAPKRTHSGNAKVDTRTLGQCTAIVPPTIGAIAQPVGGLNAQNLSVHLGAQQPVAGTHSPPTVIATVSARFSEEADLRGLKQEVLRLPRHHPLRLALKGEPDRMSRGELVVKMREWAKYLGWKDSP